MSREKAGRAYTAVDKQALANVSNAIASALQTDPHMKIFQHAVFVEKHLTIFLNRLSRGPHDFNWQRYSFEQLAGVHVVATCLEAMSLGEEILHAIETYFANHMAKTADMRLVRGNQYANSLQDLTFKALHSAYAKSADKRDWTAISKEIGLRQAQKVARYEKLWNNLEGASLETHDGKSD